MGPINDDLYVAVNSALDVNLPRYVSEVWLANMLYQDQPLEEMVNAAKDLANFLKSDRVHPRLRLALAEFLLRHPGEHPVYIPLMVAAVLVTYLVGMAGFALNRILGLTGLDMAIAASEPEEIQPWILLQLSKLKATVSESSPLWAAADRAEQSLQTRFPD